LWGRYAEAEAAAWQGIDILTGIGEQLNMGYALSALGRIAQARGQYQAGAAQQAVVTAEFLMQNPAINQESREVAAQVLETLAADLPAQEFSAFQATGRNASWDDIVASALAGYAG
jgi:hypothetical protein